MGLSFAVKTFFFTKKIEFSKISHKHVQHFNLAHAQKPNCGLVFFFFFFLAIAPSEFVRKQTWLSSEVNKVFLRNIPQEGEDCSEIMQLQLAQANH